MRRISLFLLLCLFIASEAQEFGSIKLTLPVQNSVSDMGLSGGTVQFNISIPVIYAEEFVAEDNNFIQLRIPGYYNYGITGEPSLPVFSTLIAKNSSDNYSLNLSHIDSVVIDLDDYFPGLPVWPSQPSIQKNINIQQVKFEMNDSLYNSDSWIKLGLCDFNNEGRMRGLDIGRYNFNPIQYHPGENKIKVFYNVQGELVPENSSENIGTRASSWVFDRMMSSIVQEEERGSLKKLIRDEPMTLVLLSDTVFRNSLQPFVKWKRQKGFKVIEAYTSNPLVGNDRESIKGYLSGLYSMPPAGYASPSFLLIVGDIEHVPLSQSSGEITDLFYTTYDGAGDYLPEIVCGRISVKNELELNSVINKIMEYEMYLFPEEEFLRKSILIAGSGSGYPGTYGNGQINYASDYYFNEAHGITASVFLHPDASGLSQEIRNAISEGAAFVNFTGHGEVEGWIDPSFNIAHINLLSNRSKYPLLIGNGCRTNVFSLNSGADCFAEAIVKAKNKGAIAYIGCSNDSYWKEDFYWSVGIALESADPKYETSTHGLYDKVFHNGDEPDSIWAPSLGEMIFAGNMTVQQSSSPYKEYYWMIYQLMGDPTLVPWFTIPENPPVVFPASLPADASLVNIEALPFDYVAISIRDTLVDAKHTDESGLTSLYIPEEFRGDTILLVVTGDRRQPFIRQIPDLGHFELVDIALSNESILEDSLLSNGELASLNITLTNSSSSPSVECDFVFKSSGNGMLIVDSLEVLPIVNPEDTIVLENVFSFQVLDAVVDQTEDFLTFFRADDITSNYLNYSVQMQAPHLSVISYTINDVSFGNSNGMLESGEIVTMSFELNNSGSYISDSIEIQFSSYDTLFSEKHILTGSPVDIGETAEYTANIVIPEFEEQTDFFLVPIYIGDGNYVLDSLVLVIGKYFENFSTDSLSTLPWMKMEWERDTSVYFNAPASIRSAEIGNSQSSSIIINVHVFEDDSISFNYMVSSEAGYDHLRLYIDNEEVERWSGEYGWTSYTHPLTNGLHQIEWMYKKDVSREAGQDAAWIDNIVFPKHSFIPDLYIDSIHIKRSGAFLLDESLKLDIVNIGLDTIKDFSVIYRSNADNWNEVLYEDTLLSGSSKLIVLPGTIDLSEVRNHYLQVAVRASEDIWPWNDTLTALIDHYEFPDLSISYIDHDTMHRDFVNLHALIENRGNIPVEGFLYDVLIDEEFKFGGKSNIRLEPGESSEASMNLINIYHDWLETGWHDYHLELAEDSAVDNNSVNGNIFWIATSLDLESLDGIKIYPNPVSEYLFFESTDEIQFPCKLSISDVLGREVLLRELDSNREQISLGRSLSSGGIYIINIYKSTGEMAFRARILFQK